MCASSAAISASGICARLVSSDLFARKYVAWSQSRECLQERRFQPKLHPRMQYDALLHISFATHTLLSTHSWNSRKNSRTTVRDPSEPAPIRVVLHKARRPPFPPNQRLRGRHRVRACPIPPAARSIPSPPLVRPLSPRRRASGGSSRGPGSARRSPPPPPATWPRSRAASSERWRRPPHPPTHPPTYPPTHPTKHALCSHQAASLSPRPFPAGKADPCPPSLIPFPVCLSLTSLQRAQLRRHSNPQNTMGLPATQNPFSVCLSLPSQSALPFVVGPSPRHRKKVHFFSTPQTTRISVHVRAHRNIHRNHMRRNRKCMRACV